MSRDDTRRFAELLFGVPGLGPADVVSLTALPSGISVHEPLGDDEDFEAFVERFVDTAHEIVDAGESAYLGCALRAADLPARAAAALAAGDKIPRGKRADCAALVGAWVDIDVQHAGAHASSDLPPSQALAVELLGEMPLAPTLIVDSGFGLHGWYLLDAALRLDTHEQRLAAEQLTEAVVRCAQTLGKRHGWRIDSTGNLDRILRIPGTRNFKISGSPRDVRLLLDDGPKYSVDSLVRAFAPWVDDSAEPAGGADGVAPFPTPAGAVTMPDVDVIERLRDRLGALQSSDRRKLMRLVLDGKPFAKPGERDTVLQRVASIVAFLEPDARPELLAVVLAPSLAAMTKEAPDGPTVADAVEKISRAQQDAQRKREAKRQADNRIREALVRSARRAHEAQPTDEEPLDVDGLPDPHAEERPGEGELPSEYTADELQAFAAQQRCTVEQFARRWIIQRGDSFYIYCAGRYLSPIRMCDLDVSLPRDLSPAPIDWITYKADGSPRQKTVKELLRDCATVARETIADLCVQDSRYEEPTQTFIEAAAPLRRMRARYHEAIDHWITLLGGNDPASLRAWLATVTRLNLQSCALYLSGPPGSGKGMLALGVSRLWSVGGFTELGRVLDAWNSDLLRCPLVVADEHLPQGFRRRSSAELRTMIGSSMRTLSRKHLPNADLRGALRIMLLANNDRMLAEIIGDEDLSPDDLEAIAGRFLHIETGRAAKEFLEKLGGRRATDKWVDGDLIAEHLHWLAQNVVVTPGKRFLVEGKASHMHRKLAVHGRIPSLCAEWIAKVATSEKLPDGITRRALVRFGNSRLLVNVNALVSTWDMYIQSDDVPSTTRLGRALRTLASVDEQIILNGQRYWEINAKTIVEFAEDHQICNVDKLRAVIARPITDAGVPLQQLDA